jgi:hypothetical protein
MYVFKFIICRSQDQGKPLIEARYLSKLTHTDGTLVTTEAGDKIVCVFDLFCWNNCSFSNFFFLWLFEFFLIGVIEVSDKTNQ